MRDEDCCVPTHMIVYQDSPHLCDNPSPIGQSHGAIMILVYRRLVVLDARSDMAVVLLGHTRQVSAGIRADQVKV